MHQIEPAVDQGMGEVLVVGGNRMAPVAAPVHRSDQHIAWPPLPLRRVGQACGRSNGQTRQQGHAGLGRPGGPVARHAAGGRGITEHQHPRTVSQRNHRGGGSLRRVAASPGGANAGVPQRAQRLNQAVAPPVQHVIVGQHATIDPGSGQTGDVVGVHPVVDAFRPGPAARGDGGLQIDDPCRGLRGPQYRQRIAPDVIRRHVARQRTVQRLRQTDIGLGGLRVCLVQPWLARGAGGSGRSPARASRHRTGTDGAQSCAHAEQAQSRCRATETPRRTVPRRCNMAFMQDPRHMPASTLARRCAATARAPSSRVVRADIRRRQTGPHDETWQEGLLTAISIRHWIIRNTPTRSINRARSPTEALIWISTRTGRLRAISARASARLTLRVDPYQRILSPEGLD